MKFVSSIIILLLLVSFSYAQDCVPVEAASAAKMVVELEQCRVKVQQLDNVTNQLEQLKSQVGDYAEMVVLFQQKEELYKSIIVLQNQQIASAEKAMEDYRTHIKFVQDSYKELLKDAKPNPFADFLKSILYMGVGIAAGAAVR